MREHSEPIFSRQEQGVVYLFSRYWDRIDEFKGKRLLRIHTRFPDFSIVNEGDEDEAIEFEYGLDAFRSHMGECLKKLEEDGYRRLYIVYWDDTCDEKDISEKIKQAGFAGMVRCFCLKNCFSARVRREDRSAPLRASWTFTDGCNGPKGEEAYSFGHIKRSVEQLEGAIERLDINPELYRTIGFNKGGSEFIECDHWRSIHFFTTPTRFQEGSIPGKLFVKPSGCEYFDGYFDVKMAFKIRNACKPIEQFFKEYYFYEFDDYYVRSSTCFVYSDFKPFPRQQGNALFRVLSHKYNLGVRGSMKIRSEDNRQIDSILRK